MRQGWLVGAKSEYPLRRLFYPPPFYLRTSNGPVRSSWGELAKEEHAHVQGQWRGRPFGRRRGVTRSATARLAPPPSRSLIRRPGTGSRRPMVVAPELTLLALSVVLGLVQIILSAHAASRQPGYRYAASNRDEPAPPLTRV